MLVYVYIDWLIEREMIKDNYWDLIKYYLLIWFVINFVDERFCKILLDDGDFVWIIS